MSVNENIQNSILQAIDTIAQRRIEQLKLDKTITAIIHSSLGVVNGRKIYKVLYNGGYFNAIAQNTNDAYLSNMAVYVQIPEGDFSKEKFILGRASKIASGEQQSVVSALINNYGIIGKNNVVNLTDDSFAVRSYHDPQEEQEEPESILHRYNLLYKYDAENNKLDINDGDLLLYKQDATAIMIRANFMTKLSTEQKSKANGEYGLIFNLAFNNLAASLGETQEEIFNYFAEQIYILDDNLERKYLTDYDREIQELLEASAQEDLIGTDHQLDIKLNEIQEVFRVYSANHGEDITTEMTNTIMAYEQNLQDMVNATSKDNAVAAYQDWMTEKIGEPAEKIVSYFLSSNKMVGNPFSYSSWIPQYAVFTIDLENFLRVDSIYLYKEGFVKNTSKEFDDILVDNIQLYTMKPLTDYNGEYQLKVEAQETGLIFNSSDDDTVIRVEAKLFREFYEDLTSNSQTTFFWFKQDRRVISANSDGYNMYGGLGWALIDNNRAKKLQVTAKEAQAYENHYRCAVLYEGEETPIILTYDFIIYNNSGQKFIISSDLGNSFSFDSGTPTLTILKEEKNSLGEVEYVELNDNNLYRFSWSIIDQNNQKTFLQKQEDLSLSDITINNYLTYSNNSRLLQGIEYYAGDRLIPEDGNLELATRIKYPMSNISIDSSITFEVYIGYNSAGRGPYLSIGKAAITLDNQVVTAMSAYRIYIENGDQIFQYDEYGNAPTAAKIKDAQSVLPIKAHLFTPSNIEVSSTNFKVKWFFPTRDSLIEYDSSQAKEDPITGYPNIFESSQVGFDIKKLYDYNAIDNQILCQVTLGERVFEKETTFFFGKVGDNGTNGTDMVAKIVPKDDNAIYLEQPLTIITYLNDAGNRVAFFNSQHRNFATEDLKIASSQNNDYLIAKLYQKTEEVAIKRVRWNIAGNTSSATNKKGKDFVLSEIKDLNNQSIYNVSFTDFSNSNNKFRQQILKAEIIYKDNEADEKNKTYYAFYPIPVIEYSDLPSVLPKNRIGINSKTYLKEVLYNADGRNPLYNHNQGLELINLPENYLVSWEAKGGYVDNESEPNFKLLLDKDSRKSEARLQINNTTASKVYILPNDEFNGAITNNYIHANIKEFDENNRVINVINVYAPINMSLNTFGLASLNAWDGNSITIDEEQGYIMAPQIGAGYKDTETNLFTGAVLGQADDYSSGGEHLYTGLFGYKNGMRSFFLDAETGNAYFGYPTLDTDESKVRIYNSATQQWEEKDNYNEGIIELKPNDISQIGGWRFGRKALYYTQSKDLANKNSIDYVPNTAGKVRPGSTYNRYHTKDIGHTDSGILLYAGDFPYISIKGAPLSEEEINTSLNSQLKPGDSLEIQLEPSTPTLFTIFRHNGTERVTNDPERWQENSRTFLAGINSKGELVANAIGNVASGADDGEETVTKSTVNQLRAFKDPSDGDPSYIGAKFEAGAYEFAEFFIDKDISNRTTLHITGGQTITGNERVRPIHIHGKAIELYAEDNNSVNNNALTTDANFKVSKTSINGHVGSAGFEFNRSGIGSVVSTGALTIDSGLSTSRQDFTLNSKAQIINASGAISVTGGAYTLSSSGAINISNSSNYNIKITRNNGSNIDIQQQQVYIKAGSNDNNMLAISSNTGTNTQLKSGSKIQIESGGQLYLKGVTPGGGYGNTDSGSAIVLTSGGSSLRISNYATNNATSYPFYFDGGSNVGRLYVVHDTSQTNQNEFYIGMYTNISGSLKVSQTASVAALQTTNGGIQVSGGPIVVNSYGNSSSYGLELKGNPLKVDAGATITGQLNAQGGIVSSGDITANSSTIQGGIIQPYGTADKIRFDQTYFNINTGEYDNWTQQTDLMNLVNWICSYVTKAFSEIDTLENSFDNFKQNDYDNLVNRVWELENSIGNINVQGAFSNFANIYNNHTHDVTVGDNSATTADPSEYFNI